MSPYMYKHREHDSIQGASMMRERSSPDADVRVKPMMTLPAINTDASKHEKEQISRAVQEMFEEAEFWLVAE